MLVGAVPASALMDHSTDTAAGSNANAGIVPADQGGSSEDAMPDNPQAQLPDSVNESIPDSATVVSENLAVTTEGDVKNIETGETVTDPELVGTEEQAPDPLAKTDGETFIPVAASDVKESVDDANASGQSQEQSSTNTDGKVTPAQFTSNEYGAYWGSYNNTKAFFESGGSLFVQQAKGVIDVSQWQGNIDWAKAKADGVEGAIIRISYGWDNGFDTTALRNISECKRLGIPFGIYTYSYSYDANTATAEGNDLVGLLKKAGVSPNDLSFPVYYDLERWTWTGHQVPTDPNVYNSIVNAWWGRLQAAGYNNLGVYSYTSYLNGPLNHSNIRSKAKWVASYGPRTNFSYSANSRGWQYTSIGHVNGISGNVDMNAFGNREYVNLAAHWVTRNGQKYWQDADGTYAKGKEIFDPDSNAWYWIDSNGVMAHDKDVFLRSNGGKWVRYDSNGHMVKGEDYRYGGWYYFDTTTGAMAKGIQYVPSSGGKKVYYDWTTGKMAYGEVYVNYDKEHAGWYLFDKVTGAMTYGDVYLRSNGGKWVRYDRSTGKMVKGLHKQNGAWYYFDEVTGAMAHGRTWVPQWKAWHTFDTITGRG
ncbi:glycoside hydrolase family 25 protein [Bifidobacterium moukalabense]|nr:glycoside hydrolase family 25 protein [Bifidobacterium moukalabense]